MFTFGSPVYAIAEAAQNITITVRRSGGGVGNVTIEYTLEHITTSDDDVSPTAFYTSSQQLVFTEGVVELAFQLTIHDDFVVEGNETFRLWLRQPTPDTRATLGNQRSTLVTIIDDDEVQTVALQSYVVSSNTTLAKGGVAGTPLTFLIQSVLGSGVERRSVNADVYLMESYVPDAGSDSDVDGFLSLDSYQSRRLGVISNNGNGTFTCAWSRKLADSYTVAVYLLHAGGLRGEYYYDAWLGYPTAEKLPAVTRIDRHINFTWDNGSVFSGAGDYLSVRWSGFIKPRTTEEVMFHVAVDDCFRLWVDDFLLLDRWDRSLSAFPASASVDLNSTRYYSLVLEFRELTGNAEAHLYWSSASFAKEIVPAAHLFTSEHIRGSPFANIPITPAPVASNLSTATWIQGVLTTGVAGKVFDFQILPTDEFGNRWHDRQAAVTGDAFTARLTIITDWSLGGGIGGSSVDATIVWDPVASCYQAALLPRRSGLYGLDVWINLSKLAGSPFQVSVIAGAINPTQSVVSGNGIQANCVAGVVTTIQLEARDANMNRIYSGGLASQLSLRAIHTTNITAIETGVVTDNGDGTYVFTYTPRVAGAYRVAIALNDAHVNNSPYLVSVVPNIPVGSTTTASGTALASATTNIQSTFQIITRDSFGNLVVQGSASFRVVLAHAVKGNVNGTCTDLLNGQYTCSYQPKFVGTSSLYVDLIRNGVATAISGSPFTVAVVAGPALGSYCIVEGTALVSSIAGTRANFTVRIRDYFDNDKPNAGQEAVSVAFSGPAPSTAAVSSANASVTVQYAGDGVFNVSYLIKIKGSYTIQVQVDGVSVRGSPFTMYTYPAEASPATSTLDLLTPLLTSPPAPYYAGSLITSRLTTRDAFGNVLESGGYKFHLQNVTEAMTAPLVDERNGSYLLTLRPTQSVVYPFQPKLLLSGGLNGTYFGTPDLSGSPKLQRLDTAFDFDFQVYPPTFTDTMSVFSVRWQGFLLPQFSEVYTFTVEVEGGVAMSVNGLSLMPADMWPASKRAFGSGSLALIGNELVAIEISYSKPAVRPNGAVRVYWQSLSEPRQLLPSSRLFTSWRIVNNVPSLAVVPALASPPAFTAEFPAGSTASLPSGGFKVLATVGKKIIFQVIARDEFGNRRRSGGDMFFVLFPELTSSSVIYPSIVDLNNGSYKVSFTPVLSGEFFMVIAATAQNVNVPTTAGVDALDIFLRDYNIQQSPFAMMVAPNVATGVDSTMVGAGFAYATAGVETCFQLQPRDLRSNRLAAPSIKPLEASLTYKSIRVKLVNGSSTVVTARIDEQATTSPLPWLELPVCYNATITGVYQVLLSVDGGAVFVQKTASLRVYPNVASALTSTLNGSGAGSQITANRFYTYQIMARDVWGNPLETGGDRFVVQLRGPQSAWGTIADLGTGQYVVTYLVALPGEYELETRLASRQHGLSAQYFGDSTAATALPVVRTIDANLDMDWSVEPTAKTRGYPRIQWQGYLVPTFTEVYTLQLEVFPAAIVSISGVVIFDVLNAPVTEVTTVTATVSLVGDRLHPILVEYRSPMQRNAYGRLRLSWQSPSQPQQLIPVTAFVPAAHELLPRRHLLAV